METSDIFRLKRRVGHCLTDPLYEEGQCGFFACLVGETVDVNHGQVNFAAAILVLPDCLVGVFEGANEAVKELNCVHWQVHQAMVELEECRRHSLLFYTLVVFVHEHP